MPDSIMYQEDAFVLLETNQPEQFLTPQEMLEKLQAVVVKYPEDLPKEINKFDSIEAKAQYLRDNYYELNLGAGQYFQWYVVRLEK